MTVRAQEQSGRGRGLAAGVAAAVAGLAVLAAGCGSSGGSGASGGGGRVEIMAKSLPRVGTVLVNAQGYALYMFVRDDQHEVTCTGPCAAAWPPVKVTARENLVAGPGVKQDLLSSDPDPAGGRVVTYDGWPLYGYTADVDAGQTAGQGRDLNGGAWYVMRPSGRPLKTTP